jgi:hypothetical protein
MVAVYVTEAQSVEEPQSALVLEQEEIMRQIPKLITMEANLSIFKLF